MQCALGISQMDKIDRFLKRRRELVKIYNDNFKDLEAYITLPYEEKFSSSGWHLYIIKLKLEKLKVDRRQIFEAIKAENIGVNVHYIPVYLHPYYERLGYKKGLCIEAEELYEKIITLPLFPKMKDKDAMDVIKAVTKVIMHYAK
jgi:dTDP-4-amino-4,6-dideoxygalactose transaminase